MIAWTSVGESDTDGLVALSHEVAATAARARAKILEGMPQVHLHLGGSGRICGIDALPLAIHQLWR